MASATRSIRSSRDHQTQRLEARVAPEQKSLFQRAAELRGETMTEFMLTTMREAAVKAIEQHQLILSANEQAIFVDAIMNPARPNAALREAADDYFRMIAE